MTYIPGPEDKTITAPDGSKWTSTRPAAARGGTRVRPGGTLVALARLAAADAERAVTAAAAERAAARLAERNRAALAAVPTVRARCDKARIAAQRTAAARKELARLELIAAARAADLELAIADGGRNDADGGTDGERPMTRRELAAAADAARAAVVAARRALAVPAQAAAERTAAAAGTARQAAARQAAAPARREWQAAAAPLRQAALAAEYGGTAAGRDQRRAAVFQARTAAPLPGGHRAALAEQLADACRGFNWPGNGGTAQLERQHVTRELVTASAWQYGMTVGTDARTGSVSRSPGGCAALAPLRPIAPVPPTVRPDDLSHWQNGRALVLSGTPTGLERDASRDSVHKAAIAQAGTTVPTAPAARDDKAAARVHDGGHWRADGRTGQAALIAALAGTVLPDDLAGLARDGQRGLAAAAAARRIGDDLIKAADKAERDAARAARDAARRAAEWQRPAAQVAAPAMRHCGQCGQFHAAIVACGDA